MMISTDCGKIKNSSREIELWIRKQPGVREESITDWLLYDISRKIDKIKYRAFSHQEEGRITGADWGWWVLFPSCSVALRIQAKKINSKKDNYSSIAYCNKHGLQIEKLIQDSKARNYIPLYAFFTSEKEPVVHEGSRSEGVFLVGGNKLYDEFIQSGRKRVSAKNIIGIAVPFSRLFCKKLIDKGHSAFLKSLSEFTGELNSNDVGVHKENPDYVTALIKQSEMEVNRSNEDDFERFDELKEINALIVYDASRIKEDP